VVQSLVASLVVVASALVLQATPSSAATSAAPIAVEVGFPERHRDFFDSLLSDEDTERSDREVEQALRGRRWLELVSREGEVALAVTRRSVSESSRSRTKEGKVSVTWRYVLRAGISTRGERDRLEASTTSSVTMSEAEAGRTRHEEYRDRDIFERLGKEIADKANAWILAHVEDLRPERPDAGFRHEPKFKWLVIGDGLEVTAVLPGSPAARARLEVGDRIRAIDGESGTVQMDLRVKTSWSEAPGTWLVLDVERNKTRHPIACEILWPRDWGGHRVERGADRPARAAASGPAPTAVQIARGMRPDEVERILGRPVRTVTLTPKTIWIYDGLRVVFVDDQVTDIE
jgi:hypothetical protein